MTKLNRESGKKRIFNMLAKIFALFALIIVLTFCGCVKPEPPSVYEPNTQFPQEFSGLIKDKKVYVTSVGQSVEMNVLISNMNAVEGLEYTGDSLLDAGKVEDGSVVFIVVGCSLKSLTESNISKDTEMVRARAFAAKAKSGKITLVCWHIGGPDRRGTTSDSFIEYLFTNCSLALFKATGNGDLRLSDWAIAGGVPYMQFDEASTVVLNALMGYSDV